MIIAITLIAIVAVVAVSMSGDGRDLNFSARDERQTVRARSSRR
ncbi:hypothetical protein [Tomitella biformata]|nr:hypothetical protein [Tomitella biformata]